MAPGELIVYDALGIEKYLRIDTISDPHDILFDSQNYVIASAGSNSIFWIANNGELKMKSRLPGEPDSWHINSLFLHGGTLHVTAFGRFARYREWIEHTGERTGIVFNHNTGTDVLNGLEMPNHARIVDDTWIVCDSGTHRVMQFGLRSGNLVRDVKLEKWTRGLAISDRYIFVGESAARYRKSGDVGDALASIAILDRTTWRLIQRVALPFEEVYDLVLVPITLLDGIRRGFKTNMWAIGDMLPTKECAAKVSVDVVESHLPASTILEWTCTVENWGTRLFASAKPNPVLIAYRWVDKSTNCDVGEYPILTKLPLSVPPRSSIRCRVRFRTPAMDGFYELQISLFQEGSGFFHDLGFFDAFKADIFVAQESPSVSGMRAGQGVFATRSLGLRDEECKRFVKGERDRLLELTGEYYLSCLRQLHEVLDPRTYLEIGTFRGDSLKLARCAAIAVDPSFKIEYRLPGESAPTLCLFQMPSDKFFETHDPRMILGRAIDLAFLDGLHLFEALLRDFIHTERVCHQNSVIILHDCVPLDLHMTRRDQEDIERRRLSSRPWWTGDVWKMLPVLWQYRPELKVEVFNAPPTGLVVIRGLDPNSRTLATLGKEIIEKFRNPTDESALFVEFLSTLEIKDTNELVATIISAHN